MSDIWFEESEVDDANEKSWLIYVNDCYAGMKADLLFNSGNKA